jgi:hypothetical protein
MLIVKYIAISQWMKQLFRVNLWSLSRVALEMSNVVVFGYHFENYETNDHCKLRKILAWDDLYNYKKNWYQNYIGG